jgi:serine protease Do
MKARLAHLVLVAAALIALVAAPAASAAPSATQLEKVSSLVQPGIVYLKTTYSGYVRIPGLGFLNGGRPLTIQSSCTGFFVNHDGHTVTAGHCVDKAEGRAMLIQQALTDWLGYEPSDAQLGLALQTGKVKSTETFARSGPDREVSASYGVDYGGLRAGKPLPARVLGLRAFDKGDVALLKVEVENAPALELGPSREAEIGTKIVSVGYPGSVDDVTDAATYDPSFKDGAVSSQKTIGDGLVAVTEVNAALSGGMSGGPTVDLKGRVIGINSFGPVGEPQPFNFIFPVKEIAGLLADEGVENELGPLNTSYREGLNAYFAGDRDDALARFDEVLGQVPEHEFAQQFRAKALRLPVAAEKGGGFPVAIAAGLAGLLLIGAAAAALVMRRRRGRPGGSQATPPQTPRPPRPAAAPAPSNGASTPALVVQSGPRAGERIAVSGQMTLGRGDVEVKLDDAEVSRRHASVAPVDAGVVLTDLESANGIAVNGRRIDRPVLLVHGDAIELGGVVLRVELSREDVTVMRQGPERAATVERAVA